MHVVIVMFLAFLAYGYGRVLQAQLGLATWILVVITLGLAVLLQLAYARLANLALASSQLSQSQRARLRNDEGVVPVWISALGFAARALFLAGTVLPAMRLVGWLS
jgi:hypothetical protein